MEFLTNLLTEHKVELFRSQSLKTIFIQNLEKTRLWVFWGICNGQSIFFVRLEDLTTKMIKESDWIYADPNPTLIKQIATEFCKLEASF
jgi:hypothetical protein